MSLVQALDEAAARSPTVVAAEADVAAAEARVRQAGTRERAVHLRVEGFQCGICHGTSLRPGPPKWAGSSASAAGGLQADDGGPFALVRTVTPRAVDAERAALGLGLLALCGQLLLRHPAAVGVASLQ